MKKTIIAVFLTAMLMFTSCGTERAADSPSSDSDAENTASTTAKKTEKAVKDVYEIKEKLFIATCNAIYMEPESYMDKPIKLEGYCDIYEDESGVTHY